MVSGTAIKRSRKIMVLADQLKFQRTAPLKICSLGEADFLFTDATLSKNLMANCESWGTEVVMA